MSIENCIQGLIAFQEWTTIYSAEVEKTRMVLVAMVYCCLGMDVLGQPSGMPTSDCSPLKTYM